MPGRAVDEDKENDVAKGVEEVVVPANESEEEEEDDVSVSE